MTAEQFDEWIAYFQLEPFGVLALDAEWAHWKAIYTNAHLKKGRRAIKSEKFLLFQEKSGDASAIYEKDETWQKSESLPQD